MTSLHVATLDQPAAADRSGPGEPLLEVSGLCVDYGIGPDAVRAVTDAEPGAAPGGGARPGRGERQRQVHVRVRGHPAAARARA